MPPPTSRHRHRVLIVDPAVATARERNKNCLAMAAVSEVPDLPGNPMEMGARHQPPSMAPILSPKARS
jgi:hypothetical protein